MNRGILALVLFLGCPGFGLAHGLSLEARWKDNQVVVEVFFEDTSPAADAKVIVYDMGGRILGEGYTDPHGTWTFPTPATGKYRLVVETGDGHRAKTTVMVPPGIVGAFGGKKDLPTEGVIISDGPTRSDFGGFSRGLMALLGLAGLAVAATVARRLVRRPT